jgi:hypothetical protein
VPLIWYAADSLNDISKKLAPIGSVKYVHKRTEDKRKFEVVDESNTRMSPDLQLVYDYVNSKGDTHKVTPPKKKLRTTTSRMPSEVSHCVNDDIKLPLPVNGHEYRKPEVVNILSSYKKGSKSIGLAMKKIIQLKYVPVCVRSLCWLVKMAMNGKPVLDTDWTSAGRPPLATIDEIKSIAENMEYQSGCTILPDDVSKILSDWHMMKIKDAGFVSLDSPKFSSSTKRNI